MSELQDIAMDHLVELLEKREFKKKLIEKLNKNIDLPMFDEKTEKKIMKALYNNIMEALRELKD